MEDREQALEEAEEQYFGPRFLARLHVRLHSNPVTGLITKIVVTAVGVFVMFAGFIMMVTPGPGIVGLVLGLAILSTEWRWADRWLDAKLITTVLAWPAAIAWAALARYTSNAQPPTKVESDQVGCRPR